MVRGQVRALDPAAACAASVSAVLSHTEPCRVRPELRRPPEALLPVQIPAHDAKCAAVGNTPMSAPISTSRHTAVLRATAGIVCTRANTGSNCSTAGSIPVELDYGLVEEVNHGRAVRHRNLVRAVADEPVKRIADARFLAAVGHGARCCVRPTADVPTLRRDDAVALKTASRGHMTVGC